MAFDDDMDLLGDNESPLIKDGSPPLTDRDINMVFTLPAEFWVVEEEVAQMCLSPKEAMCKNPEESSHHLKPLYVRGHINGKLISRMLIDSGAGINLMSYSIFKKLGREDDELVKTNLMLNGVGGNPMEAKGIVCMELTIGSKSLTTAFFVFEVQDNYAVILGRNWIYANRCNPSTLHQLLIQWIDNEIEVIHTDALAYIALAGAMPDWQHGSTQYLSGKDLTSYDFLSISKDVFMPVSLQLTS
jgi:hypothetical protein